MKSRSVKKKISKKSPSGYFNTFFQWTQGDNKLFCEKSVNRIKRSDLIGEDPELYKSMKRRCFYISKDNKKNKWLYDYITQIVKNLNDEVWGFDINDLDYVSYIKYYGSDKGEIGWHMDVGRSGKMNFTKNKITCIVQLSDPEDYKGGELQLFGIDGITKIPKAKGNTVIFPSYFMHRVTPVTKGLREVITAIFRGNESFK
jgi:hypothetical protein